MVQAAALVITTSLMTSLIAGFQHHKSYKTLDVSARSCAFCSFFKKAVDMKAVDKKMVDKNAWVGDGRNLGLTLKLKLASRRPELINDPTAFSLQT
jgi:hypothetical protein